MMKILKKHKIKSKNTTDKAIQKKNNKEIIEN